MYLSNQENFTDDLSEYLKAYEVSTKENTDEENTGTYQRVLSRKI